MNNKNLFKILSILILLCAGILPYAHTLSYPFHGDSITHIATNSKIRNPLEIKELWQSYPTPGRLVTFATFSWNYAIGGVDPTGYRMVNIGLHTLNGLVLWALILLMFQSPRLILEDLRKQRYAVALFAALIFLTHPLQTQAVSYVIQRSTLLATLFVLLTLVCYLKGRMAERGGGFFFCAGVCGLLAMFSKEIAFTLPLMLIMLEFYLLKSGKYSLGAEKSFHFKHLIFITLYLLIIPGLYHFDYESILTSETISRSHDMKTELLNPGGYFISQYAVLLVYLQKIFLPLRLSFDYDFPMATSFEGGVVWGLITISGLIVFALFMQGRSVLTTIGILSFFMLLAVESTIIPLADLVLEHRLYLPLTGFILAFVAWLYVLQKRALVAHLICIALIAGLCYGTYQRNMIYRDGVTLWQDVAQKYPNKGRAYIEMARIQLEAGEIVAALSNCREALKINSGQAEAYLVLGRIHRTLGNNSLAIQYLTKAVNLQPWQTTYRYQLGVSLRETGDLVAALETFEAVLQADEDNARAYLQRGRIYHEQGRSLLALTDYNKALAKNPYLIEAYNQRGWYHVGETNFKDAVLDFNRMIEMQPNSTLAYNNRGLALTRMKQYPLALKDFNMAAKFAPEVSQIYLNRGYAHEMAGDWRSAKKDYVRAVSMAPHDPVGYIQLGMLELKFRNFAMAQGQLDRAVMTNKQPGMTRYHRALLYYATERYAEAYQDLMAASREGYTPAAEFLPRVTPQLSAPLSEKP